MCGIVGYIGKRDVAPLLLEGLQRLEYRGYDSAGIVITGKAAAGKPGTLKMVKAKGRVRELEARVPKRFAGTTGIAHTRWATHGAPERRERPPAPGRGRQGRRRPQRHHRQRLRAARQARPPTASCFLSETDTEVLAHLIARSQADTLEEKVREALRSVEGTYGIAVLHADFPDRIVVARNGSPVVLGIGEKEMFVASDVAALVRHTRQVVTLDDGEMATLKADDFRTYTTEGSPHHGHADHRGVGGRVVRHGRPRHVHAQGDLRAGRRRGPGAARPDRRPVLHRPPGRAEPGRPRGARGAPDQDPRLRHLVPRGPDRRRS